MMFDVGDVVECIDDNWDVHEPETTLPEHYPRKGGFYRVWMVADHPYEPRDFAVAFEVFGDWWWEGSHFRRLEKGIDLNKLLTSYPKELEPA